MWSRTGWRRPARTISSADVSFVLANPVDGFLFVYLRKEFCELLRAYSNTQFAAVATSPRLHPHEEPPAVGRRSAGGAILTDARWA